MTQEVVAALIGLAGVMTGTVLGWLLNSRWERRQSKREAFERDVLRLRQALLDYEDVLQSGNYNGHLEAMRNLDLALRLMRRHHDEVDLTVAHELRSFAQGEYKPDTADLLWFARKARMTVDELLERDETRLTVSLWKE
jgi:hypothetical protein